MEVLRRLWPGGWLLTSVDPSFEGITAAQTAYPELDLHEGSAQGVFPNTVRPRQAGRLRDPVLSLSRLYEESGADPAHSDTSDQVFRRHMISHSGVSDHPEMTPSGAVW